MGSNAKGKKAAAKQAKRRINRLLRLPAIPIPADSPWLKPPNAGVDSLEESPGMEPVSPGAGGSGQ